jgi:hypothetical protein
MVASPFPLSADWLPAISVICSGRPIEMDKPNIFAYADETGFWQFNEQVPFNFKYKISAVQWE